MGYIITYGHSNGKSYRFKRVRSITWRGFAAALLVVLLALLVLNPQIRGQVKNFLLPGDAEVTEAALIEMVSSIKEGEPVGDAVTAFCREIIDGAKR